ncbi:hypothetical protein [Wenzhouxiangella limi]|uniref:Uncharacterized protein n=1 Tax=Wenzhouxiangella limi TaxID=2707351 RepID=A0A845UVA2_9GAMM|nr:hypothetical protein [Wenzhouxiangella limi]NDY94142.1 hypothetical protein [Wenzhouxiangella limi]
MIRLRHQRARTERPNKVRPSDEDSFDLSRDIVKLLRACYIDVSYEAGVLETDSVDCEIHYVLDPHPYIQPEHGESQMFASIRYTLDQLGRLVLPPEQLALDSDGKLADESDLLRLSSLARWYDLLEKVAPNKLDGKNDPPIVPVDFLIDGSVLHLSVLPVHQIRDRKRRIAEGRWPLAYDQEKPVEPKATLN